MSRPPPRLLVLFASCVLAPGSARGEGPLFTESLAFDLELQGGESLVVGSLVTADFDGNGGEDVAALSSSGVLVLLSDPDRTFLDPVGYPAGTGPIALAARDLDDDGFPDLVAANSGSSTLSVFLNRGDGSFDPAFDIRVGLEPRTISLEDFNLDGLVDVASSSLGSLGAGGVEILLGDGSGAFSRGQVLQPGDEPHSIAAGDFDADSIPDLAVAHTVGVSSFRGIGDGRFAPPALTAIMTIPRFITAADFLGDEKTDLAVVTNSDHALLALESLDGGKFRKVTLDALRIIEVGSAIADFDADGWKDLLLTDGSTERVLQMYRGDPAGGFVKAPPIPLGAGIWLSSVRDVTGDGILDVLAGRSAHPALLLLFEGLAPGRVAVRTVLPLNESPRGVSGIDVDGNATSDLVAFSSGALHVVETGPRGFEPPRSTPFAGSAFVDMARGDFDGDGAVEVALADVAKNEALLVFFEDAPSGRMLRHTLRGLPSELEAADLDADGRSDLVLSDDAEPTLQVLFRPGDEGGSTSLPLDPGGSRPTLAVADLDADGSLDVAAFGRGGGRLFFGNGRRGFPRSRDIDLPHNPSELRAADIDGNGLPDLLTFSLTRAVILLDPGALGAPRSTVLDFRTEIFAIEATDVDLDGRGNLFVASWSTLHVARGEAGGGFASPEEYAVGQSPLGIAIGDVDGDGILDVGTADHAGRSLSVLHGKPAQEGAFRRGDADSTGAVDLSDGITVLNALFLGAGPLACPDAADSNDDGALDLTDAIAILLHLFLGGPAPPAPGPGMCGKDPSPDGLADCSVPCG